MVALLVLCIWLADLLARCPVGHNNPSLWAVVKAFKR